MAILGRRKVSQTSGLLDVTASMQGSLVFQEPVALRISGRFEGTLETKGDLTIGEQAAVQAQVTGEMITIAGRLTGKVIAKRHLKIVPPALVEAEIWTPVLEVLPGARLTGAVHMEGPKDFMTPEEVAEYLEMEARLVEEWARDGRIPSSQVAGRWQFEKTKIDAWVASQKSS